MNLLYRMYQNINVELLTYDQVDVRLMHFVTNCANLLHNSVFSIILAQWKQQ